jgi:hypothetical protein
LSDDLQDSSRGLASHGEVVVQVLLEDQLSIPIHMDVARWVITLPGDENKIPSADLTHILNVTMHGNT